MINTITGAYSEEDNGWVSEVITLTGDIWLEVELQGKGIVVIKKAEQINGPWPKIVVTPWTGPLFKIRLIHGCDTVSSKREDEGKRYIKIITTETPKTIYYANIQTRRELGAQGASC